RLARTRRDFLGGGAVQRHRTAGRCEAARPPERSARRTRCEADVGASGGTCQGVSSGCGSGLALSGKPVAAHGQREESVLNGPLYSITSVARANSAGGTASPSALAVRALMTRSNSVGSSTGISPGFAPLKTLATISA